MDESTNMPKIKIYSKYEDYNKKNENFNKILKEIINYLINLDDSNQLEKIYSFFINLKENYLKENIIDCLYALKHIAEFLNFKQLSNWVNFELNGYNYKCSYIPQYRRFLAVYFFGDIQYSFRDDYLILDPIGEILRRIENTEDYYIEIDDDDRLIFFQIHDKNVNKLVVFCSNLSQIVYGIMLILSKFIWILDSKMPIKFEREIPFKKKYIKIDLSNSLNNYYGNLIYLINLVAQKTKSYNLIPFLLRKLFENLIYQIFQKALKGQHQNFYFKKYKPRSFSKLIKLFNYFRNEEFLEYHTGAIDDDLMQFLKLIRSKGNLAVHQLFYEISDEMINTWENKVNILLRNLFFILENVPKHGILITDKKRIKKIKNILNT